MKLSYLRKLTRDNYGPNILRVGNCSEFDAAGSFNSTCDLNNRKAEGNNYGFLLILSTQNIFFN